MSTGIESPTYLSGKAAGVSGLLGLGLLLLSSSPVSCRTGSIEETTAGALGTAARQLRERRSKDSRVLFFVEWKEATISLSYTFLEWVESQPD